MADTVAPAQNPNAPAPKGKRANKKTNKTTPPVQPAPTADAPVEPKPQEAKIHLTCNLSPEKADALSAELGVKVVPAKGNGTAHTHGLLQACRQLADSWFMTTIAKDPNSPPYVLGQGVVRLVHLGYRDFRYLLDETLFDCAGEETKLAGMGNPGRTSMAARNIVAVKDPAPGATVYMTDQSGRLSPEEIYGYMKSRSITRVYMSEHLYPAFTGELYMKEMSYRHVLSGSEVKVIASIDDTQYTLRSNSWLSRNYHGVEDDGAGLRISSRYRCIDRRVYELTLVDHAPALGTTTVSGETAPPKQLQFSLATNVDISYVDLPKNLALWAYRGHYSVQMTGDNGDIQTLVCPAGLYTKLRNHIANQERNHKTFDALMSLARSEFRKLPKVLTVDEFDENVAISLVFIVCLAFVDGLKVETALFSKIVRPELSSNVGHPSNPASWNPTTWYEQLWDKTSLCARRMMRKKTEMVMTVSTAAVVYTATRKISLTFGILLIMLFNALWGGRTRAAGGRGGWMCFLALATLVAGNQLVPKRTRDNVILIVTLTTGLLLRLASRATLRIRTVASSCSTQLTSCKRAMKKLTRLRITTTPASVGILSILWGLISRILFRPVSPTLPEVPTVCYRGRTLKDVNPPNYVKCHKEIPDFCENKVAAHLCGMGIQGCDPVFPSICPHNLLIAVTNRAACQDHYATRTQEELELAWESVAYFSTWPHWHDGKQLITRPTGLLSPPSFERWVERFPPKRREQLILAHESPLPPDLECRRFEIFLKFEGSGSRHPFLGVLWKDPRLICGRSAERMAITGPYVYEASQLLKQYWNSKFTNAMVCWATGMTPLEMGEMVLNMVSMMSTASGNYDCYHFVCVDLSRCDMTNSPEANFHFINWLMSLGVPYELFKWFEADANEAWGYNRNTGIEYRARGTLGSGADLTAIQNTYNVQCALDYAIAGCAKRDHRSAGGGDDSISVVNGPPTTKKTIERAINSLGYVSKVNVYTDIDQIDFYSGRFWPIHLKGNAEARAWGPKIGRLLCKTFWVKDTTFKSPRFCWKRHLKGVALTLQPLCNHVPVLRCVIKRTLEILVQVTPDYTHVDVRMIRDVKKSKLPLLECDEARCSVMLNTLYGVVWTEVLRVEQRIMQVKALPVLLNEPLLTRIYIADCLDSEDASIEDCVPRQTPQPSFWGLASLFATGISNKVRVWIDTCWTSPILEELVFKDLVDRLGGGFWTWILFKIAWSGIEARLRSLDSNHSRYLTVVHTLFAVVGHYNIFAATIAHMLHNIFMLRLHGSEIMTQAAITTSLECVTLEEEMSKAAKPTPKKRSSKPPKQSQNANTGKGVVIGDKGRTLGFPLPKLGIPAKVGPKSLCYGEHMLDPYTTDACRVPDSYAKKSALYHVIRTFDINVNPGTVHPGAFSALVQPKLGSLDTDPTHWNTAMVAPAVIADNDFSVINPKSVTSYVTTDASGRADPRIVDDGPALVLPPAGFWGISSVSGQTAARPFGTTWTFLPENYGLDVIYRGAATANSSFVIDHAGAFQITIVLGGTGLSAIAVSGIPVSDQTTVVNAAGTILMTSFNGTPTATDILGISATATTISSSSIRISPVVQNGAPTSNGQGLVERVRPVAMSVLATYTGPTLTNGGNVAIAYLPGQTALDSFFSQDNASLGSMMDWQAVSRVPGSYNGPLATGAYAFWVPEQVLDIQFRNWIDSSLYTYPSIVVSGVWAPGAAISANTTIGRLMACFTFEYTTASQLPEVQLYVGVTTELEMVIAYLGMIPKCMANGEHKGFMEKAKSILANIFRKGKSIYDHIDKVTQGTLGMNPLQTLQAIGTTLAV
jgi:hypothetical protein